LKVELEEQELNEDNPFDEFLNAAAWALHSTYHTVLNATPGQLVFGSDMLLAIQYKADWAVIALRKQNQIQKDNVRENKTRLQHEYKIGDQVTLTWPGILPKMSLPRQGPFEITRIHTNGTVHIKRGALEQRVNIRRITPYYSQHQFGRRMT
jgi:hypothetical protein